MAHDNPESHAICAQQGCSCVVAKDEAVRQNGELYCSQSCAEGKGCNCQGCNCASDIGSGPSINRPE